MDHSQITKFLFIGRTPTIQEQEFLRRTGVELIINMRFEKRPHPHSLIPTQWFPTVDSPLIWIPIRVLKRGVNAAMEVIDCGGKVYVHCHGGIHRAVAMGSCILIAKGYSPESAMALIKMKRKEADPYIWYIRRQIIRFSKVYVVKSKIISH